MMATHLEIEFSNLRNSIIEMMELAIKQIKNSKEAFFNNDIELAQEVMLNERRMDAMELSIDRDCTNFIALFNPVATNLRFVIAMLKINSDIERIGDHASKISQYIATDMAELNTPIDKKLISLTKLEEMFDTAISMLNDIITAFEKEDTVLVRKVFKKDLILNKINKDAAAVISDYIKDKPELLRFALFVFSIINKLERIGDHVKNIAEDIVFYIEAQVLKHMKKKKA